MPWFGRRANAETEHTPGLWSVSENAYGSVFVHGGEPLMTSVGTAYRTLIAGGNRHDTLTMANARLIAAAPDLLETIKGLEREVSAIGMFAFDVKHLLGEELWNRLLKSLGDARNAISKAEPHNPHTAEKVTQGGFLRSGGEWIIPSSAKVTPN